MARNVLVTGGTGFLGSRLVQSYLDAGSAVRVISRTRPEAWGDGNALPVGLELIELDVCDLERHHDVFAHQDLVIHSAALLHANTPAEQALQARINVEGTQKVVDACVHNEVPRLVHVSSTAAIGISGDRSVPADEDFEFNLAHLDLSYNRTKYQAEGIVLDADGPDLATVIVNPGFTFGRHRGGYRGREVIDRVLRSRVVLCTNGGLSIVHVDDVVDGIRRAATKGRRAQRYILSGQNLSFREIAQTVCEVSGRRKIVVTIPDAIRDLAGAYVKRRAAWRRASASRLYLDRRYAHQYYSSEKARVELGYEPRPFASIVADALDQS